MKMNEMTSKQLELIKSLTLAAVADGKMTYSEKDKIFSEMKQILVTRIKAKRAA